jgi:peptide/nickel transport system substrate-binding protein
VASLAFSGAQAEEEQQILRIAASAIPSLELYSTGNNDVTNTQSTIFDALFYISKDNFAPKPQLAESWTNPDPLTWVFELRQGVMFHDGNEIFPEGESREVTAEDVVYSVNFMLDTSTSFTLGPVTEVRAVDDYTVEIKTETPQPFLVNDPNRLARMYIIPREAIETKGREWFALNPIGTGPFEFESFSPDSGVLLDQNEDYWIPFDVDKLEFVVIPDPTAQTLSIQTGEVDIISHIFNYEMVESLMDDPDLQVIQGRGGSYRGLGFNVTVEPFDSLAVRRAISQIINVDEAISIVLDHSERAYGQAPPWVPFGYDPTLADLWEYNPDEGLATLEGVGFEDEDGDGFFEYQGEPFKIDIKTLPGSQVQVLTIIATQLREAGIEANVLSQDVAVWADDLLNLNDTTMFFDYSYAGTTGMRSLFHGEMIGRANTHGYDNPEVNALLDEAVTKTDTDELSALWKQAQRIIFTDVVGIPLYFEYSYSVTRDNITGYVPPWGGLQLVSTENVIAVE